MKQFLIAMLMLAATTAYAIQPGLIGVEEADGNPSGHVWKIIVDDNSLSITDSVGTIDLTTGNEASDSNDIDPDRLAGDTNDDNKVDVNIVGTFSAVSITSVPGSDDTYGGIVITGRNAGEDIAQWDLVYMDDTADEWMLADADVSGEFPAVGAAANCSGGGGWPCQDGEAMEVLVHGVIRNDGWTWSGNGKRLYLSDATPGALTESAPATSTDCLQIKAYSLDDDHVILLPTMDYTLVP